MTSVSSRQQSPSAGPETPWPGFLDFRASPDVDNLGPLCVRRGFSDDDPVMVLQFERVAVASEKGARNQPGLACGSGTASRPSGLIEVGLQVSTSSTSDDGLLKRRASGRVTHRCGA